MASAQFEGGKHTLQQACSGIIRHDFRENQNYANEDVDISRSHMNQTFGCATGQEARLKLRRRIAECDALHPPKRVRADRKTSLGICIPAPREDLDDMELREFFEKVYAGFEDLFGTENVIFGVTHFDEQHEYLDSRDSQVHMSRAGLHIEIIPWTDSQSWIPEKSKSGLNMNNFYKKNLPSMVNKMLDRICEETFGFSYQDGTKAAGVETVEQLKAHAAELLEQAKEVERNSRILETQEQIITDKQTAIEELEAEGKQKEEEITFKTKKLIADAKKKVAVEYKSYQSKIAEADVAKQQYQAKKLELIDALADKESLDDTLSAFLHSDIGQAALDEFFKVDFGEYDLKINDVSMIRANIDSNRAESDETKTARSDLSIPEDLNPMQAVKMAQMHMYDDVRAKKSKKQKGKIQISTENDTPSGSSKPATKVKKEMHRQTSTGPAMHTVFEDMEEQGYDT